MIGRRILALAIVLALAIPVSAAPSGCPCAPKPGSARGCCPSQTKSTKPASKGCCEVRPAPRPAPLAEESSPPAPAGPEPSGRVEECATGTLKLPGRAFGSSLDRGAVFESPPERYLWNCSFLI